MTLVFPVLLTVAVIAVAWITTAWWRRHALETAVIDVPNERSSHTVVTPRGGGLAIVVATLAALPVAAFAGQLTVRNALAIAVAGAAVAIVGFLDDRRHVAARWRLLTHFAAAAWVLAVLGGVPRLTVLHVDLGSYWLSFGLALLYMVWMVNLTNFMDGIDGIASAEAITVCLGGVVLAAVAAPDAHLWSAPLIVSAGTFGFLMWNWPPAKIFMGDIGSGFLGITLAVLSIEAGLVLSRLFWGWLILLGVFVVDATLTLVRRVSRGEPFYEAHRTHAYQHAADRHGGHRPVTTAVGLINICWLLPIAWLVAVGRLDGFPGVMIAYFPLVVVAVLLNAGQHAGVNEPLPGK